MQGEKPNMDNRRREGEKERYGTKMAVWAQQTLCRSRRYPMFAPASGQCPSCGGMIFEAGGYSLEHAGNYLITSCPFCGYSFCE